VQPWSYAEFENQHVHVLEALAAAMRANPHMRVHVDCGYHDLATPYFAGEHSFAHLAIPAELAANIDFSYYEAGHMMYLHQPRRLAQSQRLADFVTPRGRRPLGTVRRRLDGSPDALRGAPLITRTCASRCLAAAACWAHRRRVIS
jgi:hypothetical protein